MDRYCDKQLQTFVSPKSEIVPPDMETFWPRAKTPYELVSLNFLQQMPRHGSTVSAMHKTKAAKLVIFVTFSWRFSLHLLPVVSASSNSLALNTPNYLSAGLLTHHQYSAIECIERIMITGCCNSIYTSLVLIKFRPFRLWHLSTHSTPQMQITYVPWQRTSSLENGETMYTMPGGTEYGNSEKYRGTGGLI